MAAIMLISAQPAAGKLLRQTPIASGRNAQLVQGGWSFPKRRPSEGWTFLDDPAGIGTMCGKQAFMPAALLPPISWTSSTTVLPTVDQRHKHVLPDALIDRVCAVL